MGSSKCVEGCTCGKHFHTAEHRQKLSLAQTGLNRKGQRGHKCPEGCICLKHAEKSLETLEKLKLVNLGRYRVGEQGCWNTRVEKYRATRTHFNCDISGLPEFQNSKKKHHVDHCHDTDVIRGLLCSGCNGHLGIWILICEFFAQGWPDTEFVYSDRDNSLFRLTLTSVNCQCCGVAPLRRQHHVDHNHLTGMIRGLLCFRCNRTLGWYERWTEEIELYLQQQVVLEVV